MQTRLANLRRRATPRPGTGGWRGAPGLFPRLARLRSPVAIAAALLLLLLSEWQSSNSSRTSEPPEPDIPPFDPLEVEEGIETTYPVPTDVVVTECFTSSTAYSGGAQGEDSSNTTCETNSFRVSRVRWGPVTSTSFDSGTGTTTGSTGRSLELRRANGSLVRIVGFSSAFQTTTGPGGTIDSRQGNSASLSTPGGDPLPLPGETPAPAREPRPFPRRPGEIGPAPAPPVPARAPSRAPTRAPSPSREAQPAEAPSTNPARLPQTPPAPAIPAVGTQTPRLPGGSQQLLPDGRPAPAPAPGVRPTPGGSTFLPGGPELPNNGPRPGPGGTSSELGKLEKKLEIMLAPEGDLSLLDKINRVIDQIENIKFVLDALFPPEPYRFDFGEYSLQPVCENDSEGNPLPPLTAGWGEGEGEIVEINRKLDAIAQLIQFSKDTKQPTCGGRGSGPGSNVTVMFESD